MLNTIRIRFCIFYNRLSSAEQIFCVVHFPMNTKYEAPAKDLKRSSGLSRRQGSTARSALTRVRLRSVKKETRHQTPLFEEKQFREAIVWAYYRRSDFQGRRPLVLASCYEGFAQFLFLFSLIFLSRFFFLLVTQHKANNIRNLNLPLESSHAGVLIYFPFRSVNRSR